MPILLTQLAERLAASALLPADALDDWCAKHPGGEAQKFLDEQLAQESLTRFQAAALAADSPPPLVLGSYVILDRIGAGGMGQVFKAKHRRMKRLAAIKILADELTNSPDAVERFHREVEAAARLAHANIVMTFDADESDGVHYLVMEYVAGRDLASVVATDGPLSVPLAIECVLQAAHGLQYAHGQGVVHRDIKPSNLLLARGEDRGARGEGRGEKSAPLVPQSSPLIKILDMGLARLAQHRPGFGDALDDAPALTSTGQVMGTVDYMSPEQAEDSHSVDHRADIYSLGCTLYRLLVGRAPFSGTTVMKKLLAHREAEIPSLQSERDDVTAELDAIFRKMVAKQPAERFATMSELINALAACQAEIGEVIDDVTIVDAVGSGITTTGAGELTADFTSASNPSPAAMQSRPLTAASIEIGETVVYPRGVNEGSTASGITPKPLVSMPVSGNTMALLGFGSGVVALILSLLTGWIPCAGIAIVGLPVALALILGGMGRAKADQGGGHGRKALAGMGLALLAIVMTIALQFVGGGRVANWAFDALKSQWQHEQQWWSFASVWQAPAADAATDQLLPKKVNRFTRQSVDGKAAVPQFRIDLAGQHAVYQFEGTTNDVYVWRCSELEREAIFNRIDQAVQGPEEDMGPSHIRMSYGSKPNEKHRWVIDLPDGSGKTVALWWGGDWLFMASGQDDPDGFLRALLLHQMDAE